MYVLKRRKFKAIFYEMTMLPIMTEIEEHPKLFNSSLVDTKLKLD